ncbi:putative lipoprotein [Leptospira interrogans serovar Pyrogenes str. 200701872]|uniref:Putative lipoprotein n=1 Tax=Leptospira interrogans serovar Pyrogenes str. 200701872 TaxID=1193029 RepID=M6ZS69_LEPIR|nr:putative lipoprotein [Leptospira interrogans serovar Pyrogenes str. 200701872]
MRTKICIFLSVLVLFTVGCFKFSQWNAVEEAKRNVGVDHYDVSFKEYIESAKNAPITILYDKNNFIVSGINCKELNKLNKKECLFANKFHLKFTLTQKNENGICKEFILLTDENDCVQATLSILDSNFEKIGFFETLETTKRKIDRILAANIILLPELNPKNYVYWSKDATIIIQFFEDYSVNISMLNRNDIFHRIVIQDIKDRELVLQFVKKIKFVYAAHSK